MEWKLTAVEARVLGSLVEKQVTTPEYYPLSLNALVNACNQKSNREPFLSLPEDEVRQALHTLGDKGLASGAASSGRVAKYEHRMAEVFNFSRREEAILCVLLLRGAQTPGELRGRAERLFAFEDLADVQSVLERLMRREPPLVKMMPRQPGTKEARYVHLFSGDVEVAVAPSSRTQEPGGGPDLALIEDLQEQVNQLRAEISELREQVSQLMAGSRN